MAVIIEATRSMAFQRRQSIRSQETSTVDRSGHTLLHNSYELDPQEWLVQSINSLAQRSTLLTEAEGEKLGTMHTVRIARICESSVNRHRMKLNARGNCVDEVIPRREYVFTMVIRKVYNVSVKA